MCSPAAGDAGGAIGAAFAVWHKLGGKRSFVMDHAYWGPQFGRDDIAALLWQRRARDRGGWLLRSKRLPTKRTLCRRTAAAIADGKVVGWFQGRMEWGPRALGNRSIVCDPAPRRHEGRSSTPRSNARESFRPFAPSVLDEAVAEWFEEDDDVPFMMQVFQIRRGEAAR